MFQTRLCLYIKCILLVQLQYIIFVNNNINLLHYSLMLCSTFMMAKVFNNKARELAYAKCSAFSWCWQYELCESSLFASINLVFVRKKIRRLFICCDLFMFVLVRICPMSHLVQLCVQRLLDATGYCAARSDVPESRVPCQLPARQHSSLSGASGVPSSDYICRYPCFNPNLITTPHRWSLGRERDSQNIIDIITLFSLFRLPH